MDHQFPAAFASALSSFCLKQSIRLVSMRPMRHTPTGGEELARLDLNRDVLVDKNGLLQCENWLYTSQQYSVIYRAEMPDCTAFWLHDTKQSPVICVRFFHRLCIAGIPFLEPHAVMQRAIFQRLFYHPDPVDQVFISLMLYGMRRKNPLHMAFYQDFFRQTMRENTTAITDRLLAFFGEDTGLAIERELLSEGKPDTLQQVSMFRFIWRSWMQNGIETLFYFVPHAIESCVKKMSLPLADIVLHGTAEDDIHHIGIFLEQEFHLLKRHMRIRYTATAAPVSWRLNHITIPVFLNRKATDPAAKNGIIVHRDLSGDRNRLLVRAHIIAVLDSVFSR